VGVDVSVGVSLGAGVTVDAGTAVRVSKGGTVVAVRLAVGDSLGAGVGVSVVHVAGVWMGCLVAGAAVAEDVGVGVLLVLCSAPRPSPTRGNTNRTNSANTAAVARGVSHFKTRFSVLS